jgi:two-component sensor histidine kinase
MSKMVISRNLAHKVDNGLQVIMSLIETGQSSRAITTVRELSELVNGCVESRDEEKQRELREQS